MCVCASRRHVCDLSVCLSLCTSMLMWEPMCLSPCASRCLLGGLYIYEMYVQVSLSMSV